MQLLVFRLRLVLYEGNEVTRNRETDSVHQIDKLRLPAPYEVAMSGKDTIEKEECIFALACPVSVNAGREN